MKRLSQGETGYFNYKDSLMRLILSLLVIQGCYDRCWCYWSSSSRKKELCKLRFGWKSSTNNLELPFRLYLGLHRCRAVKPPPPIISPGLGGSYKYGPGQPKDRPVKHLQSNLSTVHFASARFTKTIMKVQNAFWTVFLVFLKFKLELLHFATRYSRSSSSYSPSLWSRPNQLLKTVSEFIWRNNSVSLHQMKFFLFSN